MLPIRIAVGEVSVDGELNDTDCARALARVLPLTAGFQVWGDEMHLEVPLEEAPRERPTAAVERGDIGLSIEEATLCIFFGPTPLSPEEEPVSAVPVTVVGRLHNAEALRNGKRAGRVTIRAQDGIEG